MMRREVAVADGALFDRIVSICKKHELTLMQLPLFSGGMDWLALCKQGAPVVVVPIYETDDVDATIVRLVKTYEDNETIVAAMLDQKKSTLQ